MQEEEEGLDRAGVVGSFCCVYECLLGCSLVAGRVSLWFFFFCSGQTARQMLSQAVMLLKTLALALKNSQELHEALVGLSSFLLKSNQVSQVVSTPGLFLDGVSLLFTIYPTSLMICLCLSRRSFSFDAIAGIKAPSLEHVFLESIATVKP